MLFCIAAPRQGHLVALVPVGSEGSARWRVAPVPNAAPSEAITVLHYAGTGLFAELSRIDEQWPRTDQTRDAAIILTIRSSFVKSIPRPTSSRLPMAAL